MILALLKGERKEMGRKKNAPERMAVKKKPLREEKPSLPVRGREGKPCAGKEKRREGRKRGKRDTGHFAFFGESLFRGGNRGNKKKKKEYLF